MPNVVFVVGLGPGDPRFLTAQAQSALTQAEVLCGYTVYLDLVRPYFPDKLYYSTGMTKEIDRCRWALETARSGRAVALVCSGDAGVYGMASPLLELAEHFPDVTVEVVPGLTAALSGGAVLGAPLAHDFCVLSLSDRLTPWEVIERRLAAAAMGDFCIALYNPSSKGRPDYLARAGAVLVTGTHLSREGVRSATMKVLETAKRLGLKCILDIDFRPNLWGLQGHDAGSSRWAEASEQVTSEYKKVLPYFDLIVGTEEEFFIAGGKTEAMEALREVRRLSKALLVFKLGDKGCAALPGDIPDSFVDEVVYPGFPVKVFNSIGAGDGFMSGFLRGWLRNEDLASCCRYANAAGAFAVSRLGCSSAYPSWTELQYFVSHGSKHKWLREDAMLEQIHWATNRRNKWKNLAVFAFDHREPFSALAAETGRDAKAITAFKNLAFRAVAEASSELEGQNDVGILVDDTYGQSVLFESNRYPFWVGRSIEKTGVNPLMFEGKADVGSTLQAWPENHVVKCLFRPGAKDAPEVVEENERQLCRLFSGARSTGHDLLLEIIVDQPQTREEQDACLLRWMRRCYELGVYPDYWKILPVADQGTWQAIEALIGEYDPYCRGILFLGLNVAEAELVKRFAALPESPRALGFAIGRSIFLEPARKWFAGQMSDEDAVATMRDCFLRLARAWNGRNRG